MTVTFQLASDIHIEYKNDSVPDPLKYIKPSADVLILAGDIGSLYKPKQLQEFLRCISLYFKIVVYVPGNHEFYKQTGIKPELSHVLNDRMTIIENNIDNLYILRTESILIDNVCITGCTLWSDPKILIPKYLVRVHGLNTDTYKKIHKYDLECIERSIEYCQKNKHKLLVVTHYPPTYDVLKDTRKKEKIHSLYATDLNHLLKKENMSVWVCGHIHKNFDYMTENGTRLIGNQVGKPKDEIKDYNMSLSFSL